MTHVDASTPPPQRMALGAAPDRLREALAREPSVRWAYLFGSAARGEPFRDLDIGVVLDSEQTRGVLGFGMLVAEMEQSVPEIPLDVVELTAASPALRASAVQQGKLLLDRDPESRVAWELEVTRRWLDLKPWVAHAQALRLEVLRRKAR